jgi:hypothetical protein
VFNQYLYSGEALLQYKTVQILCLELVIPVTNFLNVVGRFC